MNDQTNPDPQPSQPGKPDQVPPETTPPGPDIDEPGNPSETPTETPPPSPDFDQPAPGTDPNPTPISPIGEGVMPPPD